LSFVQSKWLRLSAPGHSRSGLAGGVDADCTHSVVETVAFRLGGGEVCLWPLGPVVFAYLATFVIVAVVAFGFASAAPPSFFPFLQLCPQPQACAVLFPRGPCPRRDHRIFVFSAFAFYFAFVIISSVSSLFRFMSSPLPPEV
jgi:hypothetical protein